MTNIFYPYDGHVLVARSETAIPAILTLDQNAKQQLNNVLIVGFRQSGEVAHQVMQTIGGPEYAFVFGDMLQDLEISFIIYPARCKSGTSDVIRSSGYYQILKFYNDKRAKPSKLDIITLTFLGVTIKGFLVGFSVSANAQNGSTLIQGSLTLKGWYVIEGGPKEDLLYRYPTLADRSIKGESSVKGNNSSNSGNSGRNTSETLTQKPGSGTFPAKGFSKTLNIPCWRKVYNEVNRQWEDIPCDTYSLSTNM